MRPARQAQLLEEALRLIHRGTLGIEIDGLHMNVAPLLPQ
jgi:hypothetical protein